MADPDKAKGEGGGLGALSSYVLAGIDHWTSPPIFFPVVSSSFSSADLDAHRHAHPFSFRAAEPGPPLAPDTLPRAGDYVAAYLRKATSPLQVIDALLSALPNVNNKLGGPVTEVLASSVRLQAKASAERYAKQKTLSMLDGVPVFVKENIEVMGHRFAKGTNFLNRVADKDDAIVARLRALGLIIIGTVAMDELGFHMSGINPNSFTPINPADPGCVPGGSSSGSASVVAAGLAPFALGTDAGGSIRIPATFCGIVGLKPTFERFKSAYLRTSVMAKGVFATCTHDLALLFWCLENEQASSIALRPTPRSKLFTRVGVLPKSVSKYCLDPKARLSYDSALANFSAAGHVVVDLDSVVPPELFELARTAQTVAHFVDQAAASDEFWVEHHESLLPWTHENLISARRLGGRHLLNAARFRGYLLEVFASKVWPIVDVLLLPATGVPRPKLPDDAESNLSAAVVQASIAFCQLANFLGLPAGAMGRASTGEGVQIVAREWRDAEVLAVLEFLEARNPDYLLRQPKVGLSILSAL